MRYKIEDYIAYLIKLKILKKNSEKMIDIQIELSHNWKGSGDIFDKTKDFI